MSQVNPLHLEFSTRLHCSWKCQCASWKCECIISYLHCTSRGHVTFLHCASWKCHSASWKCECITSSLHCTPSGVALAASFFPPKLSLDSSEGIKVETKICSRNTLSVLYLPLILHPFFQRKISQQFPKTAQICPNSENQPK